MVADSAQYQANNMIVLFSDFGLQGPYTGQMKAVLHQMVPGMPAIDLFADAPVGKVPATLFLTSRILEAEPYRSDRFEVGFRLAIRHRLAVGRATG